MVAGRNRAAKWRRKVPEKYNVKKNRRAHAKDGVRS